MQWRLKTGQRQRQSHAHLTWYAIERVKMVSSSLSCMVPRKFSQHQMCGKKKKKERKANTSRHPGALEAVKLTPSRDKFAALGTSLKLVCFHSWSEFASVWQWSIAWEGADSIGLRMDSQNSLVPSLFPHCFALMLWSSQYFCSSLWLPLSFTSSSRKRSHSFFFFFLPF